MVTAVGPVSAQKAATLRGFVTDASNGEALPSANVALSGRAGILFGAATDNNGIYAIGGLAPGPYALRISYVGYVTFVDTIAVRQGATITLSAALVPVEEALDEIVVGGDRPRGVAAIAAGLQTVVPADIDLIPSPDINGDLAMFLTALPGVVTVGDQGGQFFIRGGEPWQNLVLLDGMIVYQPFHVLGFFSAFPSEILNSVDIYAGGYGARYGGRLSSVIDITTRSGNNQGYAGSVSLSPFIAGITLEGPLDEKKKYSFLTSFRQSVVEQGAARVVSQDVPFKFNDGFVKIHGVLGKSGRLSLTGLQTYDRGKVGEDVGQTPLAEARWRNRAMGVRYLYLPGTLPLLFEISISGSRLSSELGPEKAPIRSSSTGRINTSVDVTLYGGLADVSWGVFARTLELDSKLGGLFQNFRTQKEFLTEVGIYGGPVFKLKNGMRLSPSLRIQSFPSQSQTFIEPRIRAVWIRGRHQYSGAFGIYHQEIQGISDRRDATSVFTAWTAIEPLGAVPRARHLMLGYSYRADRGLEVSVEGYHKKLENLSIAEWTAFPRLTTRLQQANGRVWGLDLRVELRRRYFYGYINYGLSSVEYTARQNTLQLWFGTAAYRFRPAHDRRHQLNAVGTTTLWGLDFSARWQFGSGLPYNRALGFDGFILLDDAVDVFKTDGNRRVIYEKPFNGVLPTYHRLDISAERSFRSGGADITVQASILNAYDRSNIFYLDIFTLRRANQLPIIPSLGVKVAFK